MVMPAGINELLTGGGDLRVLPWGSKLPLSEYASPLWMISRGSFSEGLRRCLVRYEDDPLERGRFGRVGEVGSSGERNCPLMYE